MWRPMFCNCMFISLLFHSFVVDTDTEDKSADAGLFKLITAAAERVWNVFFSYKKEVHHSHAS